MKKSVFLLALGLVTFGVLAVPRAGAQEYIELDALIVEGQIQRPQAVYIIQRARVDFGTLAKREHFLGRITESIQEEPF